MTEIELLVHAVPAESLAGRRMSVKLRNPEYKRFEHAQDYEACLALLYQILGQEQDDPMVRRGKIQTDGLHRRNQLSST